MKETNTVEHRNLHDHCVAVPENGRRIEPESVPEFKEYPLELLRGATNSFSSDQIVSESGEKAPNFVYKGKLEPNRWIAIKRFPKAAWPDAKGFAVIYTLFLTIPENLGQHQNLRCL